MAKRTPWSEDEVAAAVDEYMHLLDLQEAGEAINKAATYRVLSGRYPARTPKAFMAKFVNISAVLHEEKRPYLDGLRPSWDNCQELLREAVRDRLRSPRGPTPGSLAILKAKLHKIRNMDFVSVTCKGAGRYGLTLEALLDIPVNCSKTPDFMGIELKTKSDKTLQSLFSRVPTRYLGGIDRARLVTRHGKEKKGRKQLYTSFSTSPDHMGFALQARSNRIVVSRCGVDLFEYDHGAIEDALLSKHGETVFVSVEKRTTKGGHRECRFVDMQYCAQPSLRRFLNLLEDGAVNLDLTLSCSSDGQVKDHGFMWRVPRDRIRELYRQWEPL